MSPGTWTGHVQDILLEVALRGEAADAVVFMFSKRARWINGAHIPVDGAQGRPCAF